MGKIKNIALFVFPLLFFSLLTIYLVLCKQVRATAEQYDLRSKNDSAKMSQIYGYIANYGDLVTVPLRKDMVVTDVNNNPVKIEELIKRRTLIFHFDETNCFDCVEKYLPYLRKLSAKLGKKDVLIFGSFEKSQNLFLTLKGYDLQSIPIYNLSPAYLKNTALGELNMPYIYETDRLLQTKRFFIPEKTLPNLSVFYESIISGLNQ